MNGTSEINRAFVWWALSPLITSKGRVRFFLIVISHELFPLPPLYCWFRAVCFLCACHELSRGDLSDLCRDCRSQWGQEDIWGRSIKILI